MKKILNNLLHRLKEDSLNKRVGNSTREVEYKEKREIKTCLVFWSADTDQNKWFRKLESDFAGVKMDKLCFIPDGIEMLETDDLVAVRNADLGFGGKIRNGRLIAMLGCKYDLFIPDNITFNLFTRPKGSVTSSITISATPPSFFIPTIQEA